MFNSNYKYNRPIVASFPCVQKETERGHRSGQFCSWEHAQADGPITSCLYPSFSLIVVMAKARKPWPVILPLYPMRSSAVKIVLLLMLFWGFEIWGNTRSRFPFICLSSSKIATAWLDKGTTCVRRIFIRSAGMIHSAFSRLNSSHLALISSLVRTKVSIISLIAKIVWRFFRAGRTNLDGAVQAMADGVGFTSKVEASSFVTFFQTPYQRLPPTLPPQISDHFGLQWLLFHLWAYRTFWILSSENLSTDMT